MIKHFFSFYNLFFYTEQAFVFYLLRDFCNVHDHVHKELYIYIYIYILETYNNEKRKPEEEKIIKDMRNAFRLKKN